MAQNKSSNSSFPGLAYNDIIHKKISDIFGESFQRNSLFYDIIIMQVQKMN